MPHQRGPERRLLATRKAQTRAEESGLRRAASRPDCSSDHWGSSREGSEGGTECECEVPCRWEGELEDDDDGGGSRGDADAGQAVR
jgi:hypothetical protein